MTRIDMLRDDRAPQARTPLAQWEAAGRYVDWHGHRIFVRDAGPSDAETLLLIHGFPTASWDWEALWTELTQYFRVVAPDLIGFGFSAKPARYAYSVID
jgi:pimeloyl-ACP methyl ester carboxylesterase